MFQPVTALWEYYWTSIPSQKAPHTARSRPRRRRKMLTARRQAAMAAARRAKPTESRRERQKWVGATRPVAAAARRRISGAGTVGATLIGGFILVQGTGATCHMVSTFRHVRVMIGCHRRIAHVRCGKAGTSI